VQSAVEARAQNSPDEVRLAAITALGRIGRATSLPLLFQALRPPAPPALVDAALASLARLTVPETDAAILKIQATMETPLRVRLLALLGERKATATLPALLRLARDPDLEIARAALRALGLVAAPADLPALIALSVATTDDSAKTLADRAIVTTSLKILEPARRADAALAAFRAATDPAARTALLRPLGAIVRSMGSQHDVFFAVRTALTDPADTVRAAALQTLADWPDATPTTALLEFAARPATLEAARETALRGATRMAASVAAGRERSPLNIAAAFTAAARLTHTKAEKLLLVASLGQWKNPAATALLTPYLTDPTVREEAALAAKQIAARPAPTKKGGPASPSAPATPTLFNGTDLANWDGDPAVWRVRAGAIVGGSLDGNPRNEFLATKKSYANFVLRLEYRLIGTKGFVNGGVQFRSLRIPEPPNEMSGYQADIGAGHSGCLYDESRRKKFLARATDEQIKRLEKPGEWNRYEIRCEGPKTTLTLNGETTVTYTETAPTVAPTGLLALQIHGNCSAEISFRNLTLEPLP
jgi:HEAT repeat protein